MSINLKNIISNTEDYLNKLKSDLNQIIITEKLTVEFNSSEFRNSGILNNQIKKIERNEVPLIYTIKLKQKEKLPELLKNFEEFSETNKLKLKNVDRVNVSRYNKTNSDYLYVGSSTTNFHSRLKNHFGTRGIRVYSMHLSKWDKSTNYDVIVSYYKIEHLYKKIIERIIVELIEQQVWEELKPNFGKKSGQ